MVVAMEGVSSLLAALLFLTLVVLAAASSGGDDDAAAVTVVEEHNPLSDAPYSLVAFHNKHGEEIRLLSDKGTESLSASGFANRSGHWFYFYTIREGREGRHGVPKPNNTPSRGTRGTGAERFWNTLGVLANATAAASGYPAASADDDERYMLVGMETSGGDKIRLVVVADQHSFFITGQAKGFSRCPRWFFRDGDGEHQRILPLGSNGSSHGGSSHAEVVASNLIAALIKGASGSCGDSQ